MALFKKKPKTENLEELRDITDDVIEADYVPYTAHWDPYTIVTKNGEVMQTIKITGFVHEHLAQQEDDTDLRTKIREAITSCVDSTRYAIWIHTIRRKTNLQTAGAFPQARLCRISRSFLERSQRLGASVHQRSLCHRGARGAKMRACSTRPISSAASSRA